MIYRWGYILFLIDFGIDLKNRLNGAIRINSISQNVSKFNFLDRVRVTVRGRVRVRVKHILKK